MRNWHNIYTSSLKKLFKSISGWITIIIFIAFTIGIVVSLQLSLYKNSYDFENGHNVALFMNCGMLAFSIFIFTILSSLMYRMEEMVYILARPVSRKDWISAKITAIATVVFSLSTFNLLCWVIVNGVVHDGTFGLFQVFNKTFNWYVPFLLYLFVGLYCGVITMLLSPYMNITLVMVVNFLIAFISIAPYTLCSFLKRISPNEHIDAQYIYSIGFFVLPLCISICVSGGCLSLMFWQINNWKVKI